MNINEQLNIRTTPRNTNIVRSSYARSTKDYQVQLGTEDPSLDYYNDSRSLGNMSNAEGEEYDDFSGLLFAYPACVKPQCKECKTKCKETQGLRWTKGGKECYKSCRAKLSKEQRERINEYQSGGGTSAVKSGELIERLPQDNSRDNEGLSTGAKIGIAFGAIAVIGLGIYLIRKK